MYVLDDKLAPLFFLITWKDFHFCYSVGFFFSRGGYNDLVSKSLYLTCIVHFICILTLTWWLGNYFTDMLCTSSPLLQVLYRSVGDMHLTHSHVGGCTHIHERRVGKVHARVVHDLWSGLLSLRLDFRQENINFF